jgi:AcrR family transcriptional regulator
MPYTRDRKQQTRKRIVESAASPVQQEGFADVTIGEIMTAAGLR